jgi:hypothetical protein
MPLKPYLILLWMVAAACVARPADAQLASWIETAQAPGSFALADASGAARVSTDLRDHPVVAIAAADLRTDLQRVTGSRSGSGRTEIWAGTIGRNRAIDRLIAQRRLDVGKLKGAWESFVIAVVERPAPGTDRALIIAGSDRRGTAFGIYELSQAIGVSPWHWWADVTPLRHPSLYVRAGTQRFGPPSVKYRGIFINDEDWGLTPWAATNFEPQSNGPGPKTYAKVFELLLRLKANSLWPAMHKISPAFNADPDNARLADRYAIVMGSSHAEPMLRNNVGEWKGPAEQYNYVTNAARVRGYWEERLTSNSAFENIYTLGMRGIHDSGIVGTSSMEQRRALLERIIDDQRALLRKHVPGDLERVPQVFTPYKEVLDIYRAGLKVPDDVTLMWPDDNFGYIRRFPSAEERKRSGGAGIYYHLSYLGAPLAYLWLSTTPPALVEQEMGRAYDLGARRMWIANVGDIKPAELSMDYFLTLAWDVQGTRAVGVEGFVRQWAARNVDASQAEAVAGLFRDYYRLNFERRPEHLQWWLPGEKPRQSPYSNDQASARVAAFDAMAARTQEIGRRVPAERAEAYFELLEYPVRASADANRRFFAAEAHDRLRDTNFGRALDYAAVARRADGSIAELTRRFGELANGKWRAFMAVEPADGQWPTFRTRPPVIPALVKANPRQQDQTAPQGCATEILLDPARFVGNWREVAGLGRRGSVLASRTEAAVLSSTNVQLPHGTWHVLVDVIPTYADRDGEPLRFSIEIDGRPVELAVPRHTGNADWAKAVLDNRITVPVESTLEGGAHQIALRAKNGGVMIEALRFLPTSRDTLPTPHVSAMRQSHESCGTDSSPD